MNNIIYICYKVVLSLSFINLEYIIDINRKIRYETNNND